MKHDCCVVCDLLPLYLEEMVSSETADYIKAHLKSCPDCAAKLERLAKPGKAENIIAQKNKDNSCAVADFKMVKKKFRKNSIITACTAVLLALVVFIVCIVNRPVEIDYGTSEVYSKEEMDEVIAAIINDYFSPDSPCKLYSISYAGDLACQRELEYYNSRAEEGAVYSECIVFIVRFRSPFFGGGAWNPNQVYVWHWDFGKTNDGRWKKIGHGAG